MKKYFPQWLPAIVTGLLLVAYYLGKENSDDVSLPTWEPASDNSFRKEQLRFKRVRNAYAKKEARIKKLLISKGIHAFDYDLFLRAFKKEALLEVWIKEKSESKFRLLISYPFCQNSGTLGPKRQEGDCQIPEGLYHINHFNPASNFLLSLRVSYPNKSDKILSHPTAPGGEIYVHGGCQTIGCIPIANDKIQELYILAVEAHEAGRQIPIHIFPSKNWDTVLKESTLHFAFWKNLKQGFDRFEEERIVPAFKVLKNGAYHFPANTH